MINNRALESTSQANMSSSLFNKLFDLNHGYLNVNQISTLHKKRYEEVFDANKLAFILNNLDEIKDQYRDLSHKKTSLESYYSKSRSGKLAVTYVQKNEMELYGRYYALNSLSGQSMVREVRYTIFNDYYIDIDISNCHPTIIRWMCINMNIDYHYLNKYICSRDKVINELKQLNPSLSKDDIKCAILSINNGGSKDYDLIQNKSKFLIKYYKEMITIRTEICSRLHMFIEKTRENNKMRDSNYNDYNLHGKTLANICLFVENQILMIMMNYLKKKLKSEEFGQSILCFDGIMLRKNVCLDIDIYIKEMELLFTNMSIPIKIVKKDMQPMDLEALGYNPNESYRYRVQQPKLDIRSIDIKDINTFDEEDYYWKDLLAYFDENRWEASDKEPLEYLINNLHRVLAIVNDNVILKINKEEFFKIMKFKNFDTQLIHFYVEKDDGKVVDKPVQLWHYININKKYFKLFNKIEANFDFENIDKNIFQCTRRFKAKYVPSEERNNMDKLNTLLDFMYINIFSKNKEMFEYELDKLAISLKYAYKKTNVITILFSSKQGCGKNTYTDFLCKYLYGDYNTISNLSGLETLLLDKNGMQFGKKLIVVNEMSSTKDNFNANFNKLKNMITEENQYIRFLYSNGFMAKQSTDYYCLSNHKNSYIIESKQSRREFVPDIDESYADNRQYFGRIKKMIENQECGDLFYSMLMDRDITYDEFMMKTIPMSQTKLEVINNCKSDVELFIEDYIFNESSKLKELNDCDIDLVHFVKSSELYDLFKEYCINNGCKQVSHKRMSFILKEKGYESIRKRNGVFYTLNLNLNLDD